MFGPILFPCWRAVQGADVNASPAADDGKINCNPFAGLPESRLPCVGSLPLPRWQVVQAVDGNAPRAADDGDITFISSALCCFAYYDITGGHFMVLMHDNDPRATEDVLSLPKISELACKAP